MASPTASCGGRSGFAVSSMLAERRSAFFCSSEIPTGNNERSCSASFTASAGEMDGVKASKREEARVNVVRDMTAPFVLLSGSLLCSIFYFSITPFVIIEAVKTGSKKISKRLVFAGDSVFLLQIL